MAYIYRSTHESYFFISAFCRTSDYNNDTVDNKNNNNLGSYSDLDPERLNLAAISEFLLNSVASVWKSEMPAAVWDRVEEEVISTYVWIANRKSIKKKL